jgi:Mn-dependent DtxR family transcriptional regulator
MTAQEKACLEAIRTLFERGIAPSVSEIMAFMNVKSRGAVHGWIKSLANEGYLKTERGRARRMTLIEPLQAEVNRLIKLHGRDAVEKAVMA